MYKCLIVDDNVMARKALENLSRSFQQIAIEASVESGEDAYDVIEKSEIDILFLDVEMAGITGVELLGMLSYLPKIIFTTSKKDYAYDAFKFEAVDYLVKPIRPADFNVAVQKAIDVLQSNPAEQDVYFKVDGKLVRVGYDELLYVENVGNYVKVVTKEKSHIVYSTLKQVEEKLNAKQLMKVHRSFILNVNTIEDIEDNCAVINGKLIPVSRAYKSDLIKRLNIM